MRPDGVRHLAALADLAAEPLPAGDVLSRRQLNRALLARQMLLERQSKPAAETIELLTANAGTPSKRQTSALRHREPDARRLLPGYKTAYPHVYHVPKIAGQQPGYIVSALKAYKSGERSHPSMRGIAASLTEEQMKQLADFYGAPAK